MMDYLDFPMKFPWIGGCSPFSDRPKIQASCITGILQEIMGCSCGFSHGSRDIKRSANGGFSSRSGPRKSVTGCVQSLVNMR